MSWDSGVRRILFETELQFPEKNKAEKTFFFLQFAHFFAKNAFVRIWLSLVYGILLKNEAFLRKMLLIS